MAATAALIESGITDLKLIRVPIPTLQADLLIGAKAVKSFLGCWIPFPGGTPCALACFFHGIIGLPHKVNGSASRVCPANDDFSQDRISRMQIFRNVPASKFARPPGRSYRCDYCRRAAGASTSGPIVLRYLRTHRIC